VYNGVVILEYGAAVAVMAMSAARGHAGAKPAGQSASTTLQVSVTVVSSCAVAVSSARTSVRCGAAQPSVRIAGARGPLVTVDF
jgi:hypothetical protein